MKRLGRECEVWVVNGYELASDAWALVSGKKKVFGVGEIIFIGGVPIGVAVDG